MQSWIRFSAVIKWDIVWENAFKILKFIEYFPKVCLNSFPPILIETWTSLPTVISLIQNSRWFLLICLQLDSGRPVRAISETWSPSFSCFGAVIKYPYNNLWFKGTFLRQVLTCSHSLRSVEVSFITQVVGSLSSGKPFIYETKLVVTYVIRNLHKTQV